MFYFLFLYFCVWMRCSHKWQDDPTCHSLLYLAQLYIIKLLNHISLNHISQEHCRNRGRERERERESSNHKRVAMVMSVFLSFIFPPPPSLFIKAMSVVSLTSLAYIGFSETRGKHLNYSKFWNANSLQSITKIKLSSRTGMLFLYTPAFLAALTSFVLFPHHDFRTLLLKSALALHFFKRIFEVQSHPSLSLLHTHTHTQVYFVELSLLFLFIFYYTTTCISQRANLVEKFNHVKRLLLDD